MDFDGCVVWILMDSNLMSIKTLSKKPKNIGLPRLSSTCCTTLLVLRLTHPALSGRCSVSGGHVAQHL